ncbi:Acetoacetate metabolism regulatory protein atoC [Planctomycetales bacterium 10988]|nr:Acetoacetate metabolism regulatory protein atoC [Planctomycetales bacterium 10988]
MLFADDERCLQELMQLELTRLGHEVTVCPDGTTAVAALQRETFDAVLVDLDMPGLSGIEVIEHLKANSPDTEAVIMTGKSTTESAIAAVKLGAFDYLTKPCKLVDIAAVLERVAVKRKLTLKFRALKKRLDQEEGGSQLIGDHPKMQNVRRLVGRVAPTESTVLVRGETGTGKELVARAIHDQSMRADKPYVAINCGALPESLIESELFGHRKGAFTGADATRVGLFEVANGGTLFLDEIGELPKAVQAKLLRFLESGEIRRVGENEACRVDVRVVCATHRDLEKMVEEEDFREDLLFRINTFEVLLPPLRERGEDLISLAAHLFRRFRQEVPSEAEIYAPETLEMFRGYDWPGNVRELANVVEHATVLCDRLPVLPEHLPKRKFENRPQILPGPKLKIAGSQTLREIEMQVIQQVLEKNQGNKPQTAEELGVSLKTLYNKLNQMSQLRDSA